MRTSQLQPSSRRLGQLLLSALYLTQHTVLAGPHGPISARAGFGYNDLFARWECSGELCGYSSQLCCPKGQGCYTNALTQAACSTITAGSGGGYWTTYTTVYVQTETEAETITTLTSSYIAGTPTVTVVASPTASCNYALAQQPCGNTCCKATEYCANASQNKCVPNGATTSDFISSFHASRTPSPPLLGTSSSYSVVTQTTSASSTLSFIPPVATGTNVTITGNEHSSSGLSGGDIAGIVIGVLVGLFLLALLCFYCCIKGLLDGILAIFGIGSRKRRTTEVEEYERRSHHDSRAGGRTWYGARKPSGRNEKRESHTGRNLIGIGAALAGLWAILGLKRRSERREEKTHVERSDYSYYSDDYYTSASSASSGDRRTRVTRDTRRSVSRR